MFEENLLYKNEKCIKNIVCIIIVKSYFISSSLLWSERISLSENWLRLLSIWLRFVLLCWKLERLIRVLKLIDFLTFETDFLFLLLVGLSIWLFFLLTSARIWVNTLPASVKTKSFRNPRTKSLIRVKIKFVINTSSMIFSYYKMRLLQHHDFSRFLY